MALTINCPIDGCTYSTGMVPEAVAVALLNTHALSHNVPTATPVNRTTGPKLDRPMVEDGISLEQWNIFMRRWQVFQTGYNLKDVDAVPQLFQCASQSLGDALLKVDSKITQQPLEVLMATMKALAVIPVAVGVLRAELLEMHQKRDEQFRCFAARVRGKAETCEFSAAHICQCGERSNVNYTEHITRDVLMAGIYDTDIRREVLGVDGILLKSVNDVISLIEKKEMARDANLVSGNSSALSAYKREVKSPSVKTSSGHPPGFERSSAVDQNETIPCPKCRKPFYPFTNGPRGRNSKPHAQCRDCFRSSRSRRESNGKSNSPSTVSGISTAIDDDSIEVVSQISAVSSGLANQSLQHLPDQLLPQREIPKSRPVKISHHIFSSGEWRRARLLEHPTLPVQLSVHGQDYKAFSFPCPQIHPITIGAKLDSCAQTCLWSLTDCMKAGFTKDDLMPVSFELSAANKSCIKVLGAVLARLMWTDSAHVTRSCATMVYVSPDAEGFFMSLEAMVDLGLVNRESPLYPVIPKRTQKVQSAPKQSSEIHSTGMSCSCPNRTAVPERPKKLPFEVKPEHNELMRQWILDFFQSSTFNTCPHQMLPAMKGPEVSIHIDDKAKPKACHTPAPIPIHWQEQVQNDIMRDEALGVIERVPVGEPVTWCHRMVITRKHDGSPRRTVDLSPLNKHCKRETFSMEPPFQITRRIPRGTWKTVTDAWNGYHGMVLRKEDRHLTTFITPYGRWRYVRAPQGFISSGDGYNQRFDAVLSDFQSKERCVDDTIHYDTDLESHWWRTIDLLRIVGEAGIVLNPSKFQFAQRSVEFAGFEVSESSIKPLPKYLETIRSFPSPKNTTDVRSWFGLVNQVSHYAQLRELLTPFKPFLSPKHTFAWTPALEEAFNISKKAIVDAVCTGVEIFDLKRRTCLRPDWSKCGIGYFLSQKHCSCLSQQPGCCEDGWRVTLIGSRFLSDTESRYAAVEGEALAVAWGLEQTKYFTQGCDNLLVVTDHKPLVKLLGDRTLDEIENTRLFRIKQRTLPWRFDIVHMPGKSNSVADATSRYPMFLSPSNESNCFSPEDETEHALNAAISSQITDHISLSWNEISAATSSDSVLSKVILYVRNGWPPCSKSLDSATTSFWRLRNKLFLRDGDVLMYKDRVVVPLSLQSRVLNLLHSAHQGTSGMHLRAEGLVFWPGITADIHNMRAQCELCCRNAPSQPHLPPSENPDIPSTPFESIFADFFDVSDKRFLVAGDRLSGWVEVYLSQIKSKVSASSALISHLRSLFATFGVPDTLSTDGGPEFVSGMTQEFLKRWGVSHRLSSAHFPRSNGRAEVAVKKVKRFLVSCLGPSGTLNTDKFLQGMLQIRNTPDPDCKLSPAQILFGRPLQDAFTFVNRAHKFQNPDISPIWRNAWQSKELALRARFAKSVEALSSHTRLPVALEPGNRVFIQNQHGPHPNKWDRSGVVLEQKDHNQYLVKLDGSGRLTLRNRKFLRLYTLPTFRGKIIGQTSDTATDPQTQGLSKAVDIDTGKDDQSLRSTSSSLLVPSVDHQADTDEESSSSSLGPCPSSSPMSLTTEIETGLEVPEPPTAQNDTPVPDQDITRPKRTRGPPPRYIPETGKWS